MTGTQTMEDIDTWTLPDEPPQCEHSQHGKPGKPHDTGPATHFVIAYHACPGEDSPLVYPACAAWAAYITAKQDVWWLCKCGGIDKGHNMARVLQPIT